MMRIWSLSMCLFVIFGTSEGGFLRLLSEVILSLKVATWVTLIKQIMWKLARLEREASRDELKERKGNPSNILTALCCF